MGWLDARMRSGWLVVGVACLLQLAVLPGTVVNADEYYYAGQAYLLAHGRLLPRAGDPLPVLRGHEGSAIRFPVGWPLALAVGRLFSFRAMYLVPMLLHLAAGAAFARLAVRRGLPAWVNALYLFHPAIWGFSRTLMSDVPAVALVVIAVDAWEEGRSWFPGILLACGMLFRLGGLLTAVGFGLAVLRDLGRAPRRLGGLVVPTAGAGVALLTVNWLTSGRPLASPYVAANLHLLDGSKVGQHLLLYAAGLAVLPPFSLIVATLRRRGVDRWWLGALPVLAFFVPYAYHDESPKFLETLIGSQRFVLPAHAFLMICTLGVWAGLVERFKLATVATALAATVAATLGLDRIRAPYEEAARVLAACRPANVGYDYGSGRVVAGLDVKAWRLLDGSDPKRQDDVAVVSRAPVTNRPSRSPVRFTYPELEPYRSSCKVVNRFEIYDLAGRCGIIGTPCFVETP